MSLETVHEITVEPLSVLNGHGLEERDDKIEGGMASSYQTTPHRGRAAIRSPSCHAKSAVDELLLLKKPAIERDIKLLNEKKHTSVRSLRESLS